MDLRRFDGEQTYTFIKETTTSTLVCPGGTPTLECSNDGGYITSQPHPTLCLKTVDDITCYSIQCVAEAMCPCLTGLKYCLCAPFGNLDSLS